MSHAPWRRQPPQRCAECGVRPVMRRCDAVLQVTAQTVLVSGAVQDRQVRTLCSKGLCPNCAIHAGPELDFCLDHAPAQYADRVAEIRALNARLARR